MEYHGTNTLFKYHSDVIDMEEYWRVNGDFRISHIVYSSIPELRNLHVCAQNYQGWIHPGALFEICEYFKTPYPSDEIKEFRKKKMKFMRVIGGKIWNRVIDRHAEGFSWLEKVKSDIELLETAVEDILPYVFSTSFSKLRTSRYRAVWGILLWELAHFRTLLSGYYKAELQTQE